MTSMVIPVLRPTLPAFGSVVAVILELSLRIMVLSPLRQVLDEME